MKNKKIVDAYEEVRLSRAQKESMLGKILKQSIQESNKRRSMYFKRGVMIASCVLALLVTTGGAYAAYEYGYLDTVFGLNEENKYASLVEDYGNLTTYISEQEEPVVVGDYEIQILSHLVSEETHMGLVYYSIENRNETSDSIFAIINADDNGTDQYKNYYYGNGRSYTEEDVIGKNVIQLKIPQVDPPFGYFVSQSDESGKLYVVLRYITVNKPFTLLNLVETSETLDGGQDDVIGTVSLPQAQSLPTKKFTVKNDENSDCRIILSPIGMCILNVNQDQNEILGNTSLVCENDTIRVSDIKTSTTGKVGSNIIIEFRLFLKIDKVNTITFFNQEYTSHESE